ncbi:MAG: DinB family protein [Pirellulaceae bacterium]
MNANESLAHLGRFPRILEALVAGLSDSVWRWKPPTGNWSILEVVCHLRDEEREDFRQRLELTITDPSQPWPKIDPVAAATTRDYQGQVPATVLQEFLEEREKSLAWLRQFKEIPLERAYQHPKVGPVTVGELLASWAAHDLLHVRQITKRIFEAHQEEVRPYPIVYAGTWAES